MFAGSSLDLRRAESRCYDLFAGLKYIFWAWGYFMVVLPISPSKFWCNVWLSPGYRKFHFDKTFLSNGLKPNNFESVLVKGKSCSRSKSFSTASYFTLDMPFLCNRIHVNYLSLDSCTKNAFKHYERNYEDVLSTTCIAECHMSQNKNHQVLHWTRLHSDLWGSQADTKKKNHSYLELFLQVSILDSVLQTKFHSTPQYKVIDISQK